jgi:hypothetical protein
MKNFFRQHLPFLFMASLVLVGVFLGYFYSNKIFSSKTGLPLENQTKILAERVGKLAVLPSDEVPTVATVSNPEALRGQAFFAEAKVGDIVLIYSKKAVLYDPMANKVIIIAPVNTGSTPSSQDLVPKFQGEQLDTDDPTAENQF